MMMMHADWSEFNNCYGTYCLAPFFVCFFPFESRNIPFYLSQTAEASLRCMRKVTRRSTVTDKQPGQLHVASVRLIISDCVQASGFGAAAPSAGRTRKAVFNISASVCPVRSHPSTRLIPSSPIIPSLCLLCTPGFYARPMYL